MYWDTRSRHNVFDQNTLNIGTHLLVICPVESIDVSGYTIKTQYVRSEHFKC